LMLWRLSNLANPEKKMKPIRKAERSTSRYIKHNDLLYI